MLSEILYESANYKVVRYYNPASSSVYIRDHDAKEWRFYGQYPTPDIALAVKEKLVKGLL